MLVNDVEDADRLDRRTRRADDGAAGGRGHDHAAHAAAGRRRRRPHAGPDRRVHRGSGRARARLRACVRLRPCPGRVDASSATTGMQPTRRGPGRRSVCARTSRSASRATACRGRHTLRLGDRAYCALSWAEELAAPAERRRGGREDGRDDALLARLARSGAHSGPPLPRSDPALGPGDQGPHVHAHRRHRRGADHVAAGDAGRRAQLGLPLHLDARHDLHAAGAPLAQPRLGGRRVHAVRRRPRGDRGRLATDHVRDRRPPRPDRVDPRRPLRLRGRAARADRQRRLRPTPERRLRRRPRLDPAPHAPLSSVCRGGCGRSSSRRRSARRRSGGSPTRASGRPAASRSTTSRRS